MLKELDIPSSVKKIYYSALAWCDGLEHLYLHNGLEEIVSEGPLLNPNDKLATVNLPATLKKVPGGVFNYSPCLHEFQLDPANPYFCIIDGALCSKDKKTLYSVPNRDKTSYCIPEGIEVIEEFVFFYQPKLLNIELPSSLKFIKARAFQGCKSLFSIKVPASLEQIDTDAFLSIDNLQTIIMEGTVPPRVIGPVSENKNLYQMVKLRVPHGAASAYKNSKYWSLFTITENVVQ